jgi:flavin-dependent thymidylate synthase
MKVILAGYNLDREVIARISRDPRPADELRAVARQEVERARRSNQTIIFKMGHHSVAEHAVFNFDIIGVSRLALEEIEKFRLCSYTEKSQRYITLGDDFVTPEEIKTAGLEELFRRTVRSQSAFYHELYEKLRPPLFAKNQDLAAEPKNHTVLEGWAKEDARYAASLATEGQVGMTINARNLELMVRRFAAQPLAELRELNARIYALAKEVAPSIILFTEATDFDASTYQALRGTAGRSFEAELSRAKNRRAGEKPVELVDFTSNGDNRILSALLHSSKMQSYEGCLQRVKRMSPEQRKMHFLTAFERMEFYDFPLREFEYADMTFALTVSASCFAQLKRHRMATLTSQGYDPALGVTRPPSFDEIGADQDFQRIIDQTNDAYAAIEKELGQDAAAYVLTNAHRRRVLIKVNVRELYHISRLREDPTAQWDIRSVVGLMSELAREAMPLSCLLLGGKDDYPALYRKVFGQSPKLSPPKHLK